MADNSSRPKDLPEYGRPPLNEVALGVQFGAPGSYRNINANEIWDLYRDEFPDIAEAPPLPPQFETFGIPQQQGVQFSLGMPSTAGRYWFISKDGTQLVQFQPDRMLHNWRQNETKGNAYPRFEYMIEKFKSNLSKLQDYFARKGDGIAYTQAEVNYINHINLERGQCPSDFISIGNIGHDVQDDFSFNYRRALWRDDHKTRFARLYVEGASAIRDRDNSPLVALNLVVRGHMETPDIPGVTSFMQQARDTIVREFDAITTDFAHKVWEKKQ